MTDAKSTVKPSESEQSKDECYEKVATVANEMVARHGKEFAMGTLVLAARFIAEGKPLSQFDNPG